MSRGNTIRLLTASLLLALLLAGALPATPAAVVSGAAQAAPIDPPPGS